MNLLDICKKYGMSNPTDVRHWYQEIEEYVSQEKIQFAILKCQDQRQICADSAILENYGLDKYWLYDEEAGLDMEFNIDKNSIINASEPEM